jgi:hypothetical protein
VDALVVTVIVELPDPGTEAGLKDALEPAGNPLTLNVTVELNPPDGVTVTVYVALLPGVTLRLDGVALIEKSGGGLTTRVTAVEWLVVMLVPVIVIVEVPAGVVLPVVTVIVDEPPEITAGGLNVAFAPDGKPLALKVTVPVKPPDGVIVTV